MRETVHYLPICFGYKHYVRPLVQREFPATRAVLLVPADTQRRGPIAEARRFLADEAGIDVKIKEVHTDEFAGVVATGYDDIRHALERNAKVFINASSSPWALGGGYATAASYVLAEARQTDDDADDSPEARRDRVTLYYTEPAEYRVDELLTIALQAEDLREEFRTVRRATGDLRADVETDKEAVEGLVSMLESQEAGGGSLMETLEAVEQFTQADEPGGIDEAFRDIVEGIEAITDGINTLANAENQATLLALEQIGGSGGIGDVIAGLRSLAERPDSDESEASPADMFRYFAERLTHVHEVLHSVELRYGDLEEEFERSPSELAAFLEEVKSEGIAHGVRTFDDQHHVELPGPLRFGLRPSQRAILYTLAEDGPTESIQGLVVRVSQQALEVADLVDVEVPDHSAVDAVRTGDAGPHDPLLADYIFPRIKSKVQHDLTGLTEAGFVEKSRFGREVTVELTCAGVAYTTARGFDTEWRKAAFAGVSQKVADAATEFIDATS